MTYDAQELSTQDGAPVEIYTFQRGTQVWRFTSADRDVVVSGDTYTKAVIRRGNVETSGELARSNLNLQTPRDFAIAELWRISPPTSRVTCLLRQYHLGDGELVTLWSGRVLNVGFEGAAADVRMEPVFTSVRRIGLRRLYQAGCPHALYSQGPGLCNVDPADHDVAGTVDAIDGFVVSVSEADALPDGHFAGGFLEWAPSAGVLERRFIESHVGAELTLSTNPLPLANGNAVTLLPGCDHTDGPAGCDKFDNHLNHGGFKWFPIKNPFGGDPIF
jgi:uncharacterized phage protein (TIGR02218 family)